MPETSTPPARSSPSGVQKRRDDEEQGKRRKMTLEEMMGPLGEIRTVNLVLRADTQGSLEALQGILARKESDDVKLNVMLSGIGAPTEGDVLLASTAEATILCFSVTPSGSVKKVADQKNVDLKSFRIIYELIDEVDRLIKGNVEPVFEEKYLGRAEVRMVISHPAQRQHRRVVHHRRLVQAQRQGQGHARQAGRL